MKQVKVCLRPFKLKDTSAMTQWGKHEDPRFLHYNFPYTKPVDLETWYRAKKSFLRKWIYAILLGNQMVGYITLKNIKWLDGRGELGIALDPNYLDQGVGKRAICLYLHRIFRNFPLYEIHLKTSEFNERAIACYERIGFQHVDKKHEVFEEQMYRSQILRRYPKFEHDKKKLYVNYCYMKITKTEFLRRYIKNNEC